MKRLLPLGISIITACAWSNSLYQARLSADQAQRDERDHRPGDAQVAWGRVVVRAETAYARSPGGKRGAEALWLIGHGYARSNDCILGAPALQRALLVAPNAPWREELLLEMGRCDEVTGSITTGSVYAALIATGTDSTIRRQARLRQGHLLVEHGDWSGALVALEHDDSLPARLDRATALAQLGNTTAALADLSSVLATGDTGVRWLPYVEIFAAHNTPDTDSLLTRLFALPKVSDEQRSAWLLAAARVGDTRDSAASDRWLGQLVVRPAGRSVTDGVMLRSQLRLLRAASISELRSAVAAIDSLGALPPASIGAARVGDLRAAAKLILARTDSLRAGAPTGDLATFLLAEYARDTLTSTPLSSWLFGRLERDWPASPYAAKALLARIAVQPDSAPALTARFWRDSTSPYVAVAGGDAGARLALARLEDSLNRFAGTYRLHAAASARVVQ